MKKRIFAWVLVFILIVSTITGTGAFSTSKIVQAGETGQTDIQNELIYYTKDTEKVSLEEVPEDFSYTLSSNGPQYNSDGSTLTVDDYKIESDKFDTKYGYNDLALRNNGLQRQKLYNDIMSSVDKFEKSNDDTNSTDNYCFANIDYSIYGLTRDDVIETYFVFIDDNPYYYWLSSKLRVNTTNLFISTYGDYNQSSIRATYDLKIINKINEFKTALNGCTSNYDIALAIHNKIINETHYAYDSQHFPETSVWAHNVIGVLDSEYAAAVCEGYAKTYEMLLNYFNVPNVYVTGTGNGGAHAWNVIQMDDANWYCNDITWDDQPNFTGGIIYDYFNCNVSEFNKLHTADTSQNTGVYFLYDLPSLSDSTAYMYANKEIQKRTTADGYITIYTKKDLLDVANNPEGKYRLMADIDLQDNQDAISVSFGNFLGIFDGNNHKISGYYSNETALFNDIEEKAIVKNLGISGEIMVPPEYSCGCLTNGNYGTIYNCYSEVTLKTSGAISSQRVEIYKGSITTENHGLIENCINYGVIETGGSYIGGIAGLNKGVIRGCTNKASVLLSTDDDTCVHTVGGICGENTYLVKDCKNEGQIVGSSITENNNITITVGGISGANITTSSSACATILSSENIGKVNSKAVYQEVGGIAGVNAINALPGDTTINLAIVVKCSNKGDVTGQNYVLNTNPCRTMAGGVVGQNSEYADNSYVGIMECNNSGNISVNDYRTNFSGGICGDNDYLTYGECNGGVFLTRCYNLGIVTGVTGKYGEIYGRNYGASVNDCYNKDKMTLSEWQMSLPITSITLGIDNVEMKLNDTYKCQATCQDSVKTFYLTENPNIVSTDASGNITAKNSGNANVLAITSNGVYGEYNVTVTVKKGDVTNDGEIDIYDILAIQRYILGIETLAPNVTTVADVTMDGTIDIYDILAIQRHILGVELIQ